MKKFRSGIFYISILTVFATLMYWIVLLGTKLEQGKIIQVLSNEKSKWEIFTETFVHELHSPLALLLAQIVTIILIAKFFGWLCTKIKQPSVIGEMIAGIVLGPSLVGLYFPEFSGALFPKQSLGNLQFLSQIGLILFMFIVGMELDLKVLRGKAKDAVIISHASIIFPFALGMCLAYFIYPSFAPEGVQFLSFGLFMGIAMSITAFPVLARIVQERGITKTKLGTIVITCAAADDITAWCILAAVIAIVKAGSIVSSLYTIMLAIAYVFLMLKIVRPFLTKLGNIHTSKENLTKPVVAIFFLTLIISAYTTEVIGIHALFGAFMAGTIMPDNIKFRTLFTEKVEDVALVLLLPLFFVFTGLRTQIGLINDVELWKVTGFIIAMAVVGKFLGSTLAAKFVGQNWKDSLSIGALMNTRGLMELVVLNIGYDLGVLSPPIFSMMVLMALTTTFMTGPALELINWIFKTKEGSTTEAEEIGSYKIIFSFAKPESGKILLKLAHDLTQKQNDTTTLTAIHFSPINDYHAYTTDEYENESFNPVVEESVKLNRKINTLYKTSTDIENEITSTVNKGDYDLLLIGAGQSIFEGSLLGKILDFTSNVINVGKLWRSKGNILSRSSLDGRVKQIILKSHVPVGIFIDKNFKKAEHIFIPIYDANDSTLLDHIQKLAHSTDARFTVWNATNDTSLNEKIKTIGHNVTLINQKNIETEFLNQHDLILVSLNGWKKWSESKNKWMSTVLSTLIIVRPSDLQN